MSDFDFTAEAAAIAAQVGYVAMLRLTLAILVSRCHYVNLCAPQPKNKALLFVSTIWKKLI